jgi:hypothetical protein
VEKPNFQFSTHLCEANFSKRFVCSFLFKIGTLTLNPINARNNLNTIATPFETSLHCNLKLAHVNPTYSKIWPVFLQKKTRMNYIIGSSPDDLPLSLELKWPNNDRHRIRTAYLLGSNLVPPTASIDSRDGAAINFYMIHILKRNATALPTQTLSTSHPWLTTFHWTKPSDKFMMTSILENFVLLSWECHRFVSVTRRTYMDQVVVSYTGRL